MARQIIRNIVEFKELKAKLVEKWGDKLFFHSDEEYAQILRDCEPLAKYSKMPTERIHAALTSAYDEQRLHLRNAAAQQK